MQNMSEFHQESMDAMAKILSENPHLYEAKEDELISQYEGPRKIYIMRGIPGTGKTTKAKALLERFCEEHKAVGLIVSADLFWEKEGVRFSCARAGEAHAWCQRQFLHALRRGVPCIAVDNTHTRLWEYQNYQLLGEMQGYDVQVVEQRAKTEKEALFFGRRNTHGVSLGKCLDMWLRYEHVED